MIINTVLIPSRQNMTPAGNSADPPKRAGREKFLIFEDQALFFLFFRVQKTKKIAGIT